MKKLFAAIIILSFIIAGPAMADHAVTVTWTHSTGPNLAEEDCVMDGEVVDTIKASEAPTCKFNVTELKGQKIEIISRNTQGTENDGFVAGTLFTVPSSASNAVITTQSFNP